MANSQPNMSREDFLRYCAQYGTGFSSSTPDFNEPLGFMSPPNPLPARSQPNPEATSTGAEPGAASNSQFSVDDLLKTPGRNLLRYLHPKLEGGAIWFRRDRYGVITKSILRMQKSDVDKAYPTYRSLPITTKRRWFEAFAQEFNWCSGITKRVHLEFEIQAAKSFSNNLSDWKAKWKIGEDPPDWFDKDLWKLYIELWKQEKVAATAETNSQNRRSQKGRDSYHNTGSKTYDLRKDEMTAENNGKEPGMLEFLEDVHCNKETREILDKNVKLVVEEVKEMVDELQSQRLTTNGSVQPTCLSQYEINALVLEKLPKVKGHRSGLGSLPDPMEASSATYSATSEHEEMLRLANEKITTLEQDKSVANEKISKLEIDKTKKDKKIKKLTNVTKRIINKFPELFSSDDEDEDEDDDDDEDEDEDEDDDETQA